MSDTKDDPTRSEKRNAAAKELKISPDNWIPPEKPPLEITLSQQEFDEDNLPDCSVIDNLKLEEEENSNTLISTQGNLMNLPKPSSDFDHVVEGEPGFAAIMGDPALKDKNDAALTRLKLSFDFIVCRTVDLCNEINKAVTNYDDNDKGTWGAYDMARNNYITFLENLDNHAPPNTVNEKQLKQGLGYGRHYAYLFIIPVIKTSIECQKALITGAQIILEWNPHSSSSGIPIPDPPR